MMEPYRETPKEQPKEKLRGLVSKMKDLESCYLCKNTILPNNGALIVAKDETSWKCLIICPSCRDKIIKCGNCHHMYSIKTGERSNINCLKKEKIGRPCEYWRQRNLVTIEHLREKTETSASNFA